MATSRDLVIRTLNHQPVERVPRDYWPSEEVLTSRPHELVEMEIRYPRDIILADHKCPGTRYHGKPEAGSFTDAWDCVWRIAKRGDPPEIESYPLTSAAKIAAFTPPFDLVRNDKKNQARMAAVNQQCVQTSRFVLVAAETRPFDRLCFLCGSDYVTTELEKDGEAIRKVLAALHDFFCQEMELWAGTDIDGIVIQDDWATDESLAIDPKIWREVFRPLYREYCRIAQAKDKFVFFRSKGNVTSIFGDLVRVGFDAIHVDLESTNLERLAKRYRGRITFWVNVGGTVVRGPLDRIRESVLEVRRTLDFGSGGVIAQCQWPPEVPLQSIAAVFEQWMVPLPMHG
jgi:uroporphyrinogen-III decarboxylase